LKMKIEYKKPEELTPYDKNSRTHSDDQIHQIAESIKEFGFTNPILIDSDGGIIAGHGRLLAAKLLGLDTVPVINIGHLTVVQRQALVIADNKIALNSGWDNDVLASEIQSLIDSGFNIDILGFNPDELAGILDDSDPNTGLTDEDACGDVPDEPVTKTGDVWVMGKHRLLCGDSTRIDELERLTDGQLVDMWLTDPPYNVAYEGKTKESLTIKNDSMGNDDFRAFLRDCYVAANAVMKPGAVFYIWHADSEGYNFRGAAHDAGWQVRQCLIWNKNVMVMGRQDYHWKHEPCLYGWKEGAGHLWATDRKQVTILEFDRPTRNTEHPTMKPVALFEYQMLNNTKGGDIVLDSFGGSGTTLIAAEKNGRVARLMELDPKYCDVIVKRWQDFTGKKAVLESDGSEFNDMKAGGKK